MIITSNTNTNTTNGSVLSENSNQIANSNTAIKSKETIDDWTQDLTKYFDLKYAKYVTVILIVLFIFYHGYLNSFYGKLIITIVFFKWATLSFRPLDLICDKT
jgi:hypothetical protein